MSANPAATLERLSLIKRRTPIVYARLARERAEAAADEPIDAVEEIADEDESVDAERARFGRELEGGRGAHNAEEFTEGHLDDGPIDERVARIEGT